MRAFASVQVCELTSERPAITPIERPKLHVCRVERLALLGYMTLCARFILEIGLLFGAPVGIP